MKSYTPLFIIVVVLILVISIFIPSFINFTPEKVFARYIKFQRARDYKGAYNSCFSLSYKKRIEFSTFEKIQEQNFRALGFTLNKEIVQAQALKDKKGHNLYVIVAMGFYPTGAFSENYVFIKKLKGWKIDGFDIMSHLLDRGEREKMKSFIEELPPEVRESYERILQAEGRAVE